jgi:hypothetical protein
MKSILSVVPAPKKIRKVGKTWGRTLPIEFVEIEPDRELWVLNEVLVDGSPEKCPAPGRVGGRNSHPPLGRVTASPAADGVNVAGATKQRFQTEISGCP